MFMLHCCISAEVIAQSPELIHKVLSMSKDSLPYKLNPELPQFNIRLLDSASIFNTKSITKGRPTVLMLFSPDCSHCQKMTEMLLANIDSLSNIDFYMVSNAHNVADIRKFADKYKLAGYKNIKVVGQDYDFFFLTHYGTKFVPDFALYDSKKKLIKLFESTVTITELYDATH